LNKENLLEKKKPEVISFAPMSTERAELEHFARAVKERRGLALAGGDEVHNVAVLEAIVRSAQNGSRIRIH
jgi:predicted dehydrogenase